MATTTLYCSEGIWYNYQYSLWENPFDNEIFVGYIPQVSGYTSGMDLYTFGELPSGIEISSAIIYFSGFTYAESPINTDYYIRASNSYKTWDTSAPSGASSYNVTLPTYPPSGSYASLDITTQINTYAVQGQTLYLYLYQNSSSYAGYIPKNIVNASYPYIVITYTSSYSTCGYPTSIGVDNQSPDISSLVSLSWSGASAGTNNAITGYKVYISTTSGGAYTELTGNVRDVTTSQTSGSLSVTSPDSYGNSYFYKVKTIGTVSGYDSGISTTYATTTSTRPTVTIKQWTGTAWTTDVSSNVASWSQAASSEIIQTAGEISSKVSRNAIISEINQTAEEIKIQASKISFEGLVTANSYFKILTDGSMEAVNGLFGGNLTAENTYCNNLLLRSGKEMTVGLWKIGSAGVYYPSGEGFNYLAFLYNGYNAYITSQAPMYLGPDQSNPLYVSGNGVTFTITNNNYSAGFIQDYYMDGETQVLYQEICLICNQGGSTYETAKGNIGTQTHRWDVLWVDTAHYNTHPSDSSIKVKHDIVSLRDVGEIIDKVDTKEFKYNNDSEERTRFGLIYEDLVNILPEVCRKDKDSGELGIEYDDFIAILLKQAQESRKKEKELEKKIQSLEERLSTLEKLILK